MLVKKIGSVMFALAFSAVSGAAFASLGGATTLKNSSATPITILVNGVAHPLAQHATDSLSFDETKKECGFDINVRNCNFEVTAVNAQGQTVSVGSAHLRIINLKILDQASSTLQLSLNSIAGTYSATWNGEPLVAGAAGPTFLGTANNTLEIK